MDTVITLQGVSKKYQLYRSMRQRLTEALHPFRRSLHEEFWALRDISLEIVRGETLGILGVNGSGKSTLLQLICSIIQPSSGSVTVHGRVAALLELGAGFNPELSGRENAEMNCSIMGLDTAAIRACMPRIEDFAEIGAFFDQPVKTYSSGMFMRVAFATAIHVDPDILVIDEALAVGDARFQQKCFEKFREFQQAGKTILLVTHDRFTVPRLCTRAIILDEGRLLRDGATRDVVEHYSRLLTLGKDVPQEEVMTPVPVDAAPASMAHHTAPAADVGALVEAFIADRSAVDRCAHNPTYNRNERRYGVGGARIVDYLLCDGARINPVEVASGSEVDLYIKVIFDEVVEAPLLGLSVKLHDGTQVFGVHTRWLGTHMAPRNMGEVACFRVNWRLDLAALDWFVELAVARSETEVMETRDNMLHIRIVASTRSTGLANLRTVVKDLDADLRT